MLHRADTGEQRAHHPGLVGAVIGLAGDRGLRAARGLHRCAGRARLRLGALNNGAADHGAGRAFADLAGLVARGDTGRARGHSGLQDVLRHIRGRRALALEHILGHIGQRRARGDRRLQDVLGPVDLGALALVGAAAWPIGAAATCGRAAASEARALRNINESFGTQSGAEGNNVADYQADHQESDVHCEILHPLYTGWAKLRCRLLLCGFGIFLNF
jgi:hypothetical protein